MTMSFLPLWSFTFIWICLWGKSKLVIWNLEKTKIITLKSEHIQAGVFVEKHFRDPYARMDLRNRHFAKLLLLGCSWLNCRLTTQSTVGLPHVGWGQFRWGQSHTGLMTGSCASQHSCGCSATQTLWTCWRGRPQALIKPQLYLTSHLCNQSPSQTTTKSLTIHFFPNYSDCHEVPGVGRVRKARRNRSLYF